MPAMLETFRVFVRTSYIVVTLYEVANGMKLGSGSKPIFHRSTAIIPLETPYGCDIRIQTQS